jgi:hypothetical protein
VLLFSCAACGAAEGQTTAASKYFEGFWCNSYLVGAYSSGYIFEPDGTFYYFYPAPPKGSLFYGISGEWRIVSNAIQIKRRKVYFWSKPLVSNGVTTDAAPGAFLTDKPGIADWTKICDFSANMDKVGSGAYEQTINGVSAPFFFLMRDPIDESNYREEKFVFFSGLEKLDFDAKQAKDMMDKDGSGR